MGAPHRYRGGCSSKGELTMRKIGDRLIAAAEEAREIARGTMEPAGIYIPDDFEITPAMIEAGLGAYFGTDRRIGGPEDVVIAIFEAMAAKAN